MRSEGEGEKKQKRLLGVMLGRGQRRWATRAFIVELESADRTEAREAHTPSGGTKQKNPRARAGGAVVKGV